MRANARNTHAFKCHYWARAVISNSTPCKQKATPKLLITRTHKNYLGSGHYWQSYEQLHRPTVLRNVETASSENNYKIIVSEAANSQKRALLKTIVGIVNIKNTQTYTTQGIQPLLYFLPFRPNIVVKQKSQSLLAMVGFFYGWIWQNNLLSLCIYFICS